MQKLKTLFTLSGIGLGLLGGAINVEADVKIKNEDNFNYPSMATSSWGNGGSFSYYTIGLGETETWGREDARGVLINYGDNTYYVSSNFKGAVDKSGNLRSSSTNAIVEPLNTYLSINGDGGKIKVKNERNNNIAVSISKWQEGENGAHFTISKGGTETWTRTSDYYNYYNKGFVMHIKEPNNGNNTGKSYYIKSSVNVTINSSGVPSIDGKQLSPIYQAK